MAEESVSSAELKSAKLSELDAIAKAQALELKLSRLEGALGTLKEEKDHAEKYVDNMPLKFGNLFRF